MTKERRLGRGLEALLGRPLPNPGGIDLASDPAAGGQLAPAAPAAPRGDELARINVYEIESNPFQPRRDFDEAAIAELSESIKAHGLIQPLVVRRAGGRWQLVAGERRLRAAIKAGWAEVPCQVRAADDRQMAEIAIVENLQRKDLNPLEKAASFHDYLERYACTQDELAGRLKIDRSTIANLIRFLELPQAIQDAVRRESITHGHARALLPLGDESRQLDFCARIQAEAWSVRATEEHVADLIREEDVPGSAASGAAGKTARKTRSRSSQLAALEQQLRHRAGNESRSAPDGRRTRQDCRPLCQPGRVRAAARAVLRASRAEPGGLNRGSRDACHHRPIEGYTRRAARSTAGQASRGTRRKNRV